MTLLVNLGKKMLMKMGWKEGEGLGVEGKGRTDNVQVKRNKEERGLGFRQDHEEDLSSVKQIENFSQVLESLNKAYATPPLPEPSEEEEEKPRMKRSRRGYKKFLDAKDVSKYDKESMRAILGGVDPK
jgi:hypothetical protein